MRRRFFTFLSALSLMLCVGVAVLWITAPTWRLSKRKFNTIYTIEWAPGLSLEANTVPTVPAEQAGYSLTFFPTGINRVLVFGRSNEMNKWLASRPYHEQRLGRVQWEFGHVTDQIYLVRSEDYSAAWDLGIIRRLFLPPEVLLIAFAILPLVWIITRKRRRAVPGLCGKCGYDLRASPTRCPECGTPLDSPCKQGG